MSAEIKKNFRRVGRAGLATLALAAMGAKAAEAAPVRHLTPAQRELNREAQQFVVSTVHKIGELPIKPAITTTDPRVHDKLTTYQYVVPAPLQSGGKGWRTFTIFAPMDDKGNIEAGKTQAVTIEEQVGTQADAPIRDTVTLMRNPRNNTWETSIEYASANASGEPKVVGGEIAPVNPHIRPISRHAFTEVVKETADLVNAAAVSAPIPPLP